MNPWKGKIALIEAFGDGQCSHSKESNSKGMNRGLEAEDYGTCLR